MLRPALALTPETAALLARAMFPETERIARTLDEYQTNPARRVFVWKIGGQIVSAAGLLLDGPEAEILHIGTHPEKTNRGYERQLLNAVADALHLTALTAETDDEAVNFYRRCGFEIQEASARGEQRRFWCLEPHPDLSL